MDGRSVLVFVLRSTIGARGDSVSLRSTKISPRGQKAARGLALKIPAEIPFLKIQSELRLESLTHMLFVSNCRMYRYR